MNLKYSFGINNNLKLLKKLLLSEVIGSVKKYYKSIHLELKHSLFML